MQDDNQDPGSIEHSEVSHYGTEDQKNDSSIATRFTSDHGVDGPDEGQFYFTFISRSAIRRTH